MPLARTAPGRFRFSSKAAAGPSSGSVLLSRNCDSGPCVRSDSDSHKAAVPPRRQ